MTRTRWGLALVLIGLVAGGWWEWASRRPAARPVGAVAAHGAPALTPNLLSAMVSVYYYAETARLGRTPVLNVQPMPLRQAVSIIQADRSFGASTRRRRAIGKLGAAYKVTSAPHPPHVDVVTEDLRTSLVQLGAPPGVLTGGTEGQPEFQQLENSVYQQLDQVPPDQQGDWKPQCCSCLISCEVGTDGGTGKAQFEIKAGRTLDSLKKVTDPQKWHECNPLFFQDSYYVRPDCPSNLIGGPTKGANPPAVGTDWTGQLYEDRSSTGSSLTFKNLLTVWPEGTVQPPPRRFNYKLCLALSGTATLQEDCGWAIATEQTGEKSFQSRFGGLKIVNFTNAPASDVVLKLMVDEIEQVAVCCGLNEPQCECSTPTCYPDRDFLEDVSCPRTAGG